MSWFSRRHQRAIDNGPSGDCASLSLQLHRELEESLRMPRVISPLQGYSKYGFEDSRSHASSLPHTLYHSKITRNPLNSLPPELLSQVLSYVVVTLGSIHVYAPHNNSKHGWRLSLCPETFFDPCWGSCSCMSGRPTGTATEYMDTALLLVSRAIRRTTLDLIFARNRFVFTDMHDLRDFAGDLPRVAARMQSLRLYHTVDDSSCWSFQAENMLVTRRLLKSLRCLDLRVLLSHCSLYESIHEDGFLNELCHFRKPLLKRFECHVQWRGHPRYWATLGLDEGIPNRVQAKLVRIFSGAYADNIPLSKPPPEKMQEADQPLNNKKGIIAWSGY